MMPRLLTREGTPLSESDVISLLTYSHLPSPRTSYEKLVFLLQGVSCAEDLQVCFGTSACVRDSCVAGAALARGHEKSMGMPTET